MTTRPDSPRTSEIGSGRVQSASTGLRLMVEQATARAYSNAQWDDYAGRRRAEFPWRPPVTLSVRARFSHGAGADGRPGLRGTAGFGFWNDFFMAGRGPTLPRAVWFFYASPPSDMRFSLDMPGFGWKAATIDALRPATPLLLASAAVTVPLMRVDALYQRIWPGYQRALRICEHLVPAAMDDWHTYNLEWQPQTARFAVDGQVFLECAGAPSGPLGLALWLDNQFLVALPWGRLRHGLLATPDAQWLELSSVEVNGERIAWN